MFWRCQKLENIDLVSFNTEKVENMFKMFNNCKRIKAINLSNFITPELTNAQEMFAECYTLKTKRTEHHQQQK